MRSSTTAKSRRSGRPTTAKGLSIDVTDLIRDGLRSEQTLSYSARFVRRSPRLLLSVDPTLGSLECSPKVTRKALLSMTFATL